MDVARSGITYKEPIQIPNPCVKLKPLLKPTLQWLCMSPPQPLGKVQQHPTPTWQSLWKFSGCFSFCFLVLFCKKLQSGAWIEAFRPQVAVLANFWCWQEILYSIKKAMSVHYVSREAILHYTQRKKLCSGLTIISCQDYSSANSNRTTAVW